LKKIENFLVKLKLYLECKMSEGIASLKSSFNNDGNNNNNNNNNNNINKHAP